MPFRRRPELEELLRWCTSAGHAAVRLVTGDGGAGKTRLALRLGTELAANGWQPLWVKPGSECDAVGAVHTVGQPCVLVVDYAETRSELVGLLNDVAADRDGPDVRVLLLARCCDGEWWRRVLATVEERTAALLEATAQVTLGPVRAAGGPQEVFDDAVTAFAGKLGVRRPDARLILTDPDPVVLVVHAAALLAVVDYAAGDRTRRQAASGLEVLEALLRHENRYWVHTADGCGLGLDVSVLNLVVAVGCLVGAESETAAVALLSCVPDLDSAERCGRVARWLHDLYPGADADDAPEQEWLGPLRPDRLAEQFVVGELARRPELIPRLFTGMGEGRASRALTVLGRAALTQDRAVGLLRRALTADLERLAVPALSVAVATNPVMGELLSQLINDQPVPQEALTQVAEAIPYPSLVLAATAAVVIQRLADGSADDSERAGWLVELSNWLGDLGRREEALAAIEKATDIYRQFAEDRPDAFLPGLAASLNNQSTCLGELGRREEALAAIEKATDIYRQLAEDRPDAFLPGLTASLINQSNRLADLQRREEALAAIDHATDICLQLAEDNHPDFRLLDLAMLRNNKSACLAELGRREEALAAIEHATDIFRRLAEDRPDAFLPDLAVVLNNQSGCMAELGRQGEALAAIEEAVSIRRQLAEDRPDAFLPDLAASLNNESRRLRELGRREEALAAIEKATHIFRQLAGNHPHTFLPRLATSLYNLADTLSSLNRDSEALAIREEADAARSGNWHSRKA